MIAIDTNQDLFHLCSLGLSLRAYNTLMRGSRFSFKSTGEIVIIADLLRKTKEEISQYYRMGSGSLSNIESVLASVGLSLLESPKEKEEYFL